MKKLFIGIKGHVVCFDRETGKELWRTKLRSSTITNVVYTRDSLHAYGRGHLYSLNMDTGAILWENELAGLGYGYCMIATEDSNNVNVAQAQQITAAVGAATATNATAGT